MGVYIWNRLPSEYQEVEYIQSSGTQYIDTLFTPTPKTKISIDMQFTSTTTQQRLFGVGTPSTSYMTFNAYINGSTQWSRAVQNGEGTWQSTGVSADTTRHIFELDNSTYKIYTNGTQVHSSSNSTTSTTSCSHSLPLLANYYEGGVYSQASAKLYGCKLWDNGTLVRDFIPCYRKSDSVVGLYDLVNSVFYTNSGSGTFSKGSDVNTYRESSLKNAYIGEYIPMSGLLGYRPLQSDLKDESGNGNNGSWYIYSSGSGSFGTVGGKTGARVTKDSGDSSEHHIVTALNYSGPTVTMCGWVYYSSIQSSGRRPGVLTNSTSSSNYISLSPRPAQSSRWTVGGNGNLLTSTTSATTGTWYFVAGILTSSGKKIYVNGTQIASDSTGFTTGQGSIWRLGCGQLDNSRYGGLDGYVRHCAVYNRELTADEILKYYNLTA